MTKSHPDRPDPPPAAPARADHALDRPIARVVAFGVFLLVMAALAWINRESLFPPADVAKPAADDPVARCVAERAAGIDQMLKDGAIDAGRAALLKSRAEAFCVDRFGKGSGPPPLQ